MTPRLRIALPLAQAILASALITVNLFRSDSVMTPSWHKPEIQFCHALNAPAALAVHLLREATYQWAPYPHRVELALETIVYVGLVWLIWFLVALQIEGRGRCILMPRSRLRGVADLFGLIVGAGTGVVGLLVRHQLGAVTTYSNLLSVPYFLWAVLIIGFYGCDLRLVMAGR